MEHQIIASEQSRPAQPLIGFDAQAVVFVPPLLPCPVCYAR
jgi:hypothetical protein